MPAELIVKKPITPSEKDLLVVEYILGERETEVQTIYGKAALALCWLKFHELDGLSPDSDEADFGHLHRLVPILRDTHDLKIARTYTKNQDLRYFLISEIAILRIDRKDVRNWRPPYRLPKF